MKFLDDLTQLIAIMVAGNQQKRRRLFLFEPAVSSQNDVAVGASRMNQAIARQVRAVDHVKTENTQPFGQAAEHPVGGERDFISANPFAGSNNNIDSSTPRP